MAPAHAPAARGIAWYWIALALLLLAAVVAVVVILTTGDGDLSSTSHLTITNADLKESLR